MTNQEFLLFHFNKKIWVLKSPFLKKAFRKIFLFSSSIQKASKKIAHHIPTFFFQVKKVCIVLNWKRREEKRIPTKVITMTK